MPELCELPRIAELKALSDAKGNPNGYFRDFDVTIAEWPTKRKQFRDLESSLQGLDAEAWAALKAEASPLLTVKDQTRGWQALFDILNHARAYNHLRALGCEDIRFIERSKRKGQRTPDLEALLGGRPVVCEVKTLNASEDEAVRRRNGGVGTTSDHLHDAFFRKLDSTLAQTKIQMQAYCSDEKARHIAYVVVNFDDSLHEYADRYHAQIDQHRRTHPMENLEVVLDIKPPFYAAMV